MAAGYRRQTPKTKSQLWLITSAFHNYFNDKYIYLCVLCELCGFEKFGAEELRKKTLLTPIIQGGIITITSGRYYANITAQMNFSSGTLMAITLMRF